MLKQTFTFTNDAHHEVFVYTWLPEEIANEAQGAVRDEAQDAAQGAVRGTARDEAQGAARDMAQGAAQGAVRDMARGAARDEAQDAARGAAQGAARDMAQGAAQGAVRGVLQIAHGMAETAQRYERLAEVLTSRGWIVVAGDHRGHGRTAEFDSELGCIGEDGFGGMVRDMSALTRIIRSRYPDLPLFLMGHSMGSFLTQKVMYTAPEPYSGFILSGTNGPRGMIGFGEKLARMQCLLQGERHPSLMLNALVFGSYNKRFLPPRTPFDWLSRDDAEVDKYVSDPHCGFLCSAGFFQGFFSLLQEIHRPKRMRAIPKDKPIYIFGGDEDPVGLRGDGVKRLASLYNLLLIRDVELKLYPGGRHEMLNETNRDEVMRDLADWLERHI